MKLVLCGKSWVAADAVLYARDIAALFPVDFELSVVPSRSDPPQPTWQPSMRATALSANVPVFEEIEQTGIGEGDVLVSLEFDLIVKRRQLAGARAYNMHFSDLPKYRGCITSVWPIRNGERVAGVTLHELTPGIDAGPIVDQRVFDLPEFMNSFELYRLYHRHAFELFKRHLQPILRGEEASTPQDATHAMYYNRTSIDFTARELSGMTDRDVKSFADYARSLMFEPYQLPLFRGRPVGSVDIVIWEGEAREAAVLDGERHVLVRCRDGWVRLGYA